jgi:transposase
MNDKKPVHTREFRDNAVTLALRSSKSLALVGKELGVPVWKLRNWIKESKEKSAQSADLEELNRLRNDNIDLRKEVEFLKKAAAYFAKEQQ